MQIPDRIDEVPLTGNNRNQTLQTLKLMWGLAKEGKKNPVVYYTARQIVAQVPNKQFTKEVEAIYNWVVNNIRYTMDVYGIETLQHPDRTIDLRQGDCDDHSILIASLLMSIGHPVRFMAIKVKGMGNNYVHVFAQTKIGSKWIALDSTEPEHGIGYVHPYAYDFLRFAR
jgi:transglutaminase-like putative cysteine protease